MRPTIDIITLGVNDLEKSMAFYRDGLGLPTPGVIGTEYHDPVSRASGAIVAFELQNGLMLTLYPRTELAKDGGQLLGTASSTEFSLGHFVSSQAEVDATLSRVKAAGATITESPRVRPWGIYSGYFKDPDGHLWEVIWNQESDGASRPAESG